MVGHVGDLAPVSALPEVGQQVGRAHDGLGLERGRRREDAQGAAERLRRFLVDFRIGSAEADLDDFSEDLRPACAAERDRYRRALELLDAAGGDPLAPFRRAAGEGRIALAASSATHALLPLLV